LSSLLKISVSALFVFLSLTSSGSNLYRPAAGAGEAGMGYVCVMKNSFWNSFQNQASLAFNRSLSIGFNYDNRFNISDLGTRSAGIVIPAGSSSIGLLYSHFGNTHFHRERTGLACGLKLSDNISAGVQVNYLSEKTSAEHNNYRTLTYEAGIIVTPSDNLSIGIHLFNPVPNSIRKTYLPSTLRIGAGTTLSQSLFTGIEAEITTGSKLIFRTGVEYEAAKKLWLRSGFSTENNSFSFGLGYLAKIVIIDIGFISHEKLGLTSSISLIFNIH
jgi:hypothetical protein